MQARKEQPLACTSDTVGNPQVRPPLPTDRTLRWPPWQGAPDRQGGSRYVSCERQKRIGRRSDDPASRVPVRILQYRALSSSRIDGDGVRFRRAHRVPLLVCRCPGTREPRMSNVLDSPVWHALVGAGSLPVQQIVTSNNERN